MKLKLILALMVVLAMAFAACGEDSATPGATGNGGDDGDRPHYEFLMWWNYTWRTPSHQWGDDYTTRHWGEMFNVHMHQDNPDANAEEVLNLRIMADDLPDVIWMERGPQNMQMSQLGLFVPVNDMIEMVGNSWYNDNIGESTRRMFEVDGVNYIIPNWSRVGTIGDLGGSTGGNNAWMKTTSVWEAVGSPDLNTFEDLFDYAVAIRDANLTNPNGVPIIPALVRADDSFGIMFVDAIYRSMGGVVDGWWWSILPDGTYGLNFRNPYWRAAVMEANRWHRYGLFPTTNLTQSYDQFRENLMNGLGGLIFYDHSADDSNQFRRIHGETFPGDSIEIIMTEYNGRVYTYLPALGLSPSRIYHDHHGTLGWNGSFITTSAERPERIFETLTWLLTPLGSIEMMFGPQGHLWDELDAEGFPVLHTAPAGLTSEQRDDIGLWNWDFVGHANNVDNAKFAANNRLPEYQRNWVETMQATVFTPNLRLTDEFALIPWSIEPGTDLAIARTTIQDHFEEMMPQIIMAPTAEDAEALFDAVLAFAEANGAAEIEEVYNERFQHNVSMQGGSIFRPPGTN